MFRILIEPSVLIRLHARSVFGYNPSCSRTKAKWWKPHTCTLLCCTVFTWLQNSIWLATPKSRDRIPFSTQTTLAYHMHMFLLSLLCTLARANLHICNWFTREEDSNLNWIFNLNFICIMWSLMDESVKAPNVELMSSVRLPALGHFLLHVWPATQTQSFKALSF